MEVRVYESPSATELKTFFLGVRILKRIVASSLCVLYARTYTRYDNVKQVLAYSIQTV